MYRSFMIIEAMFHNPIVHVFIKLLSEQLKRKKEIGTHYSAPKPSMYFKQWYILNLPQTSWHVNTNASLMGKYLAQWDYTNASLVGKHLATWDYTIASLVGKHQATWDYTNAIHLWDCLYMYMINMAGEQCGH